MRYPLILLAGILFLSSSRADDPPAMTPKRKDVQPFRYVPAKVPFYPAGAKWGAMGQPIAQLQLPLDAAESLKHLVHPVDFEVKLFAADPAIKRPICLNWDERGRLWIAESVDYPNELKPAGQGRDRIVICEDTNGDGRADKFTVFADQLSIPTSFAFYRGGIIVHQAPHTLFLKDTDGDDKADVRQVLFTGWSTADTHAGPSNLQWGLDNWLYGIVGYAGFEGTIGGEKHSFRTGFYRLRPPPAPAQGGSAGAKFEFLRNTNNNTWGIGFSEEGILFASTANGNPSVYLPIPNRYYEAVRGWSSRVLGGIAQDDRIYPITDRVRQVDHHGRFTAAAGHALYTARTYPQAYWNRAAFICEPTGHLAATFIIEAQGADFRSRHGWNLFASADEWTAPIMAEVGPDGNVWVIDWYNIIVQHNPTPPGYQTGKGNAYETELRDQKHGRVYRLVHKHAQPSPPFTLQDARPEKLLATLKHDNLFWRRHAQRLLVERGQKDVVPALIQLTGDKTVDEIGLNAGVVHALWTLHGLGVLDGSSPQATAVAVTALRHKSASVRRNALGVLPRNQEMTREILAGGALDDADAQVRLAALLALADKPPHEEAGAAVVAFLNKPANVNDRWLPDAATSAAATNDLAFLQTLATRKVSLPARTLEVGAVVAEHYARGGPATSVASLLSVLPGAPAPLAETLLAGLARGWPKNRPAELTAQTEQTLTKLLPALSPTAQGQLIKLALALGSKEFTRHAADSARALLRMAGDDQQEDGPRLAAARQVVEFQPEDPQVVAQLLDLVSPRTSPELAGGILDAVAASQAPEVGRLILKRMRLLTPQARAAALRVLLSRPESTRTLLGAINKGEVPLSELALDQKQALAAHPDRQIAAHARQLLERGGGLPSPDRQKVLAQLLPLAKLSGDADRGKLVFKKVCATCHLLHGEGNKIGPDLTGMAVHPREQLLTDILDPNRSVEGNYRVYTVTTEDGRVLNGLLASETKTAIELYDVDGKKHILQRASIEQLAASPKSLMPEGFEKQLSEKEIVDLLTFLTQRGKYVPLPLGKVANVVSTRGMFNGEEALGERMIFADWSPKNFEGVPFHLVDPQGECVPNVVMLYGVQGKIPPRMPKSVSLPCNTAARALHFLSGVSGWGYPIGVKGSVTMIVRLHYADGQTEDHPLKNGEHFADYIRRVDVPGSKFAFGLRSQQVRYLAVYPRRPEVIERLELVKGTDATAPVVMAITMESR